MDKYTRFQVISNLNTDQATPPVRACLCQSSMACEADDLRSMTTLATFALNVAHNCDDKTGKALALVHLGVSTARRDYLKRAYRFFMLDYRCDARHNEGGTLYSLGVLSKPGRAVGYYHEALTMFETAKRRYAARGDAGRFQATMDVCVALRGRIEDLTPSVWVDGGGTKCLN